MVKPTNPYADGNLSVCATPPTNRKRFFPRNIRYKINAFRTAAAIDDNNSGEKIFRLFFLFLILR